MKEIRLTDIEGIRIGHAEDLRAATGCTVVLTEEGAAAGVDVRGGAPGTKDTDLLRPVNLVEKIHGVVLTGGSAFGLDAAAGAMRYLEERDCGFDTDVAKVPIVCGAVLFDLAIGDPSVRPDKAMGYQACLNARDNSPSEGNVGAGTGATVGKILGMERAMKSGLGAYGLQIGDLKIGAVVAVNCLGDVLDPATGEVLAGVLQKDRSAILNTEDIMMENIFHRKIGFTANTTLGTVVTNASLTKSQATKVASMAHNGYARTIRPAHTMVDGDTIFTVATGKIPCDISVVGMLAARVVGQAVLRAVLMAEPLMGFKCAKDLHP
ncbi:MAG: P1 family peptidase [Deltaproteobacteria bacterium]|nr:P1 family peptidase [Deltaproteobacteria bacterium]